MFLLLLHDFPEFLTEYCYHLCELIPYKAVQLRNIILSAIPSNIVGLPEPCNAALKLESINDVLQPVRSIPNHALFESIPFKKDLDNYLLTRSPGTFVADLRSLLVSLNAEKQIVHNGPLMNALVLYLGHMGIQTIKTISLPAVANSPFFDIFQSLFTLDSQGLTHLALPVYKSLD